MLQGCFGDAKMSETGLVVKKPRGWVGTRSIKRPCGKNCCLCGRSGSLFPADWSWEGFSEEVPLEENDSKTVKSPC